MTVWRIRQVGPLDAAAVLASDVFDGPALPAAVAAFLGSDGAGDPRNILIMAEHWERFLAFNRVRGNAAVPAGFLLGFMRRWRTSPNASAKPAPLALPKRASAPKDQELQRLISAAPCKNWQFHASDLCRLIGKSAYDARIVQEVQKFECSRFCAILAVHGRAALSGEINK
jgi:hypothetical protein